ncbi:capsular exopolysaccharide family [Singulisphaera sp. GP187]|uniref:polysaccharide biosynthesis tyrosine autokinase n=1 Tax=Singulisphaera sp. GP187 TaxID=1882752 RepID=UPI0009273BBF|nr:polysaccharide biosynthesis tyrosine autokinase [Singulisphaera sp. GP187]SIO55420.1 capsular exopolysaccharide family [Singulisphaera sp. GP187]
MAIQQSITGPGSEGPPSRTLQNDLVALWDVLKRGWKFVSLGLLVGLTLASIYLAKTKRIYQASTSLLVIQHGGRPLNVSAYTDPNRISEGSEDPVPTHMVLIRSPLVIQAAVDSLGSNTPTSLAQSSDPVGFARGNLKVSRPDRLTKIIVLQYQSASTQESLQMIHAIVASYKKLLETNYQKNNQEVITLVSRARDDLKKELDLLQAEYHKFRKDNPGFAIGSNGQTLTMRKLEQWSQGINNTTDLMIQLKTQLELIKKMESSGSQGNAISLALSQFPTMTPGGSNGQIPQSSGTAGSYEQLQKELAEVKLKRSITQRMVDNLKAGRPNSEATVSEDDVAGSFKLDPNVAELYRDLKRAQLRYDTAKRATRNTNDPSLKYARERKVELESEIEDLWRQRRPLLLRQLTREMANEGDLALQKAEAELTSLAAEEASLYETLKESKEKSIEGLKTRHETLVKTLGADAPESIEAKSQVDRATEQLGGLGKDGLQSELHDRMASIEHSLKSIGSMREEYETKLKEDLVAAKQSELGLLEEERLHGNLDRQKALYNTVLDQLKQAQLVSDYSSISCQVIEPPSALPYPVQPRVKMTLLMGLMTGLFLGIGLAYLADRLDPRIRTLDEVRKVLEFRLIGTIPKLLVDQLTLMGEVGLVSHAMPRSVWAEAYRSVRTSLEFLRRSRQVQLILVTSAHSGDGKTTTASNLAISFAMAGRKVLLVDGDLRKPAQHKIFRLKGDQGLSHILRRLLPLSRVVQQTQIENLDFIASGSDVDNPAELLASSALTDFVAEIRNLYDMVVFDSSPLLAVTDPSILSAVVDGVVLVVRPEATKRHDAERTVELLKTMESPVLGFIVNGIDRQNASGYGQGYGYGYGYGYGTYGRGDDGLDQITPSTKEITTSVSSSESTNGLPQPLLKD